MKKTIFREKDKDKSVEIGSVDFIYEPPEETLPPINRIYATIKLKETYYKVMGICDEFSGNPEVQIRHIILLKNDQQTIFFQENLK